MAALPAVLLSEHDLSRGVSGGLDCRLGPGVERTRDSPAVATCKPFSLQDMPPP